MLDRRPSPCDVDLRVSWPGHSAFFLVSRHLPACAILELRERARRGFGTKSHTTPSKRTMTTMARRARRLLSLVAAVTVLGACGDAARLGEAATRPDNEARPSANEPLSAHEDNFHDRQHGPPAPPPVTIHYFDQSIELEPWSYCYESGCADGAPPGDPPDVGSPGAVIVEYPLEEWSFKAYFTRAGDDCAREFPATLEEIDTGRFRLQPAGYADTYDVTLFGRGEGDLSVTFRWTTPSQGPLPRPKAYLGVVTDHDGEMDSYGVEMSIRHLARDPRNVRARITVTAANGKAITFHPILRRRGCQPEGSLYWDGPTHEGTAAAALGGPPFEYTVDLTLDGHRYEGRGTWPDDEIRGAAPYVRLDFTPDLPRLTP